MASEVIFDSSYYTAWALSDGSLVVTCKRRRPGSDDYGARLVGPTASSWTKDIRNAIDASEANALCRAIVSTAAARIRSSR